MTALVPRAQRTAEDVGEEPPPARVRTVSMDAVAQEVVLVSHGDVAAGVGHVAQVAFDVELEPRVVDLVGAGDGIADVLDSQYGPAHRVEAPDLRRRGVLGRLFGGHRFGGGVLALGDQLGIDQPVDAPAVPGRLQDGVVGVRFDLLPRAELLVENVASGISVRVSLPSGS